MSEKHLVRVSGDELRFSASHFITLGDGTCEPLHGHDFRVSARIEGPLDENRWVVDFVALERVLRAILDELDHRVLLPTGHPSIRVETGDREVEVRFGDRRWVFPRAECRLLPVENTTAELIARHIGQGLLRRLQEECGVRPTGVEVQVEESPGYTAVWRSS